MPDDADVGATVKAYLASLKDDAAAVLTKAKVRIYHATLDSTNNPILVVPPRWFQCLSPLNDSKVVCVRTSFLCKGLAASQNISACARNDAKQFATVQPWIDLLATMKK